VSPCLTSAARRQRFRQRFSPKTALARPPVIFHPRLKGYFPSIDELMSCTFCATMVLNGERRTARVPLRPCSQHALGCLYRGGQTLFILGIPPAQLVFIRLVLSVLILLFIFLCFNRKRLTIPLREIPYFVILGWSVWQLTNSPTTTPLARSISVLGFSSSTSVPSDYSLCFSVPERTHLEVEGLLPLHGPPRMLPGGGGYRIDLLRLNGVGILSGLTCSLFVAFYVLYGEKD